MDSYELLANAIIEQAVTDYRKAQKKLCRDPKHETASATVKGVEQFIHSQWYRSLTTVDPDYLLERLKKEIA